MGQVTELIRAMHVGSQDASEQLYRLVYHQLKLIARKQMARESVGHTLQATALVNEAYLRLANEKLTDWRDRRHFYGVASRAMQRILIDAARKKLRTKRGGGMNRQMLSDPCAIGQSHIDDWLDLDQAISCLEQLAADKAELVRLHFFSGLTMQECADVMEVSKSTAERSWRFARAWLRHHMSDVENLNVEVEKTVEGL